MADAADDWAPVAPADDWEAVNRPEPLTAGEALPEAFLDRLRAGQAISRILSAAGHQAKEGFAGATPTGFSDENLNHLIDLGVFHDPAKGRGGPIQIMNEAVLMPTAQAWQGLMGALNAGVHGAGGAIGQIVEEFGVRAGQAISRILSAAGHQAKEGFAGATPTGFSDENLNHLIDLGVFHDPAKGRGGPIQIMNEAVLMPTAQAWQGLMGALNAGVHGAGGAMGQIVEEFGGSQGTANRAKNETINFANFAMIEGGMGRFSRPQVDPQLGITEKVVGGLPQEADFVNGSKVLAPETPRGDPAAFKSWFEGSKVADESGNPISVFHGTSLRPTQRDFAFDKSRLGEATGAPSAKEAFFFTEDLNVARSYADSASAYEDIGALRLFNRATAGYYEKANEALLQALGTSAKREGRLVSANLAAKNPLVVDLKGSAFREESFADTIKRAKADGHDSVKFENAIDEGFVEGVGAHPSNIWAVFEPEQIKVKSLTPADIAQENLRRLWKEDGITPAEAVHDAERDAFLKHEITAKQVEVKIDPEAAEILTETGGKPGSLGAAATELGDVPLDVQPARPAGSLLAGAQQATEKLFDIGRDIQMKLAPMARGTMESMATVKDYMNSMRRNAWDWSRIDTDLQKRFTPEQRARMWNAMDEESLSMRLGEPASAREHQGLATLTPEERAAVVDLDNRQQIAWLRARDLGMVEGEGIPMHAPRMVLNVARSDREAAQSLNAIGYDMRTRTPGMKHRKYMEVEETERAAKAKYGEDAVVARDIRTVALGTSQLEDAVAGRTLIENIKDVGKRTGEDVVAEGFQPDKTWFTVDHPAFKSWRPNLGEVDGKLQAVKDAEGNTIFEQVPIYVRGDFEGPLRSAMWGKTGETYGAMMSLKGKTMGLIMNSPMIHNLVEFGRAFPAMPTRIFKAYFDGYKAKHDPAIMHEAIDSGLVPIGHRFFNQDITGMMETPDMVPGRSITAKVTAFVPGLFDEAAGVAVKRAIDKAGDFWHNTLLWDRIADLQMGLYTNFRGDMIAKGMDQQTASRVAAHLANRYAGALPKEAMSEAATKISNFMFFSRSFTFGNLGVMKDMLTGLPKDVLAQIERDAGFRAGAINEAGELAGPEEQAVTSAKSLARRKAMATIGLDLALMYAGNSVLQSAFNVMLGQGGWTAEGHEYLRRFRDLLNEGKVHPLSLLNPFHAAEKLSATDDNEPGRKERVLVGYAKDGTAIYGRNPVGKIGEEFSGYFGSPIDMLRKKQGTIARPLFQILSNDAGFGRKVYDPTADSAAKYAGNIWAIVKHLVGSQLPEGQITAFSDLVKGEGDAKVNALQAFGPFAGVTFSKGAPGGPAVGEMYAAKNQHEFAVNQALPDIRKQIKRGDVDGAIGRMTELDIPQGLQRWYIKTTLNPALRMSPRAVKDFYLHATDEQKARFERAQQAPQPPQ